MRIGIVAAEPSGDVLASGLMQALKICHPDILFEGIGGQKMAAEGLNSWVPLEKLSVMGLVEVLKQLPSLLKIRRDLVTRWKQNPPDLFIGVDAPDFNLGLELQLRAMGIPTVQFVCPTIWAWRQGRVHKLKRAVDLVLSIFPFEEPLLRQYGVPVCHVGHPLAQTFPKQVDREAARLLLGISADQPVLAVLPGSRRNELNLLSEPFLKTALACSEKIPDLRIVTPLVNDQTRKQFEQAIAQHAPDISIQLVAGDTRTVLSAADVGLVASGTATFEGLLCECPMVVGYKANPISYNIVMGLKLLKTPSVAMANILSGEKLAPEFIQNDCVPEQLVAAVLHWFDSPESVEKTRLRYREIHAGMNLDTNQLAANAVLKLL